MPNMHGDEFAARAQGLIPGVPTLFVSGYAEPGQGSQRARREMLKKPFRRVQLADKLRHVLRVAARQNGGDVQRSQRGQTH
jgi:CheY-like chemotaxis protein